jgi:Kef-type K+ transport system membrane component KefB/mannitol/fructose-specific phosphotransferase system IIA component (Ntr-type)
MGGSIDHSDSIALYLGLTLILLVARALGELAKKLNQPSVMGELLAGVILGQTCLGVINPALFSYLYGPTSEAATALSGVTSVCVSMYMLVAGLEMNLKNAMKKKRAAFSVGIFAIAVPFGLGFIFCYFFPVTFGLTSGGDVLNFSLFTATAMSITALPVVAKTLRDLHLFRTDLGVVVMSAAVLDDIIGWTLFAISLAVANGADSSNGLSLGASISLSLVYVFVVLTIGAWLTNKLIPYIQAYFSFPAGVLGFVCLFAFSSATFALWVGLHNTLGCFLAGVAIGNSRHFPLHMRQTLDTFISFMLAPIFFGSVCLSANFATDFNSTTVFSILFLACFGKLLGAFVGAKLARSNFREALAISVCMNARGAMELVLAQVALQADIIDGQVFVALVFMAIVTSVLPGPLLRRILKRPPTITVISHVPRKGFRPRMTATSMKQALQELCEAVKHPELTQDAVERELARAEPNYGHIAIVSVFTPTIKKAIAAIGVMVNGIVFNPELDDDQHLTNFVVLLIIPEGKTSIEFDFVREVSQVFNSSTFQTDLLEISSHVELQALFQIEKFRQGMAGHNPDPAPVIAHKETGMIALDVNEIIKASPIMGPMSPIPVLDFAALSSPRALHRQATAPDVDDDSFLDLNVQKRTLTRRETNLANAIQGILDSESTEVANPRHTTNLGAVDDPESSVRSKRRLTRESSHVKSDADTTRSSHVKLDAEATRVVTPTRRANLENAALQPEDNEEVTSSSTKSSDGGEGDGNSKLNLV